MMRGAALVVALLQLGAPTNLHRVSGARLLQSSSLTYVGAFRLPIGRDFGPDTFEYGGWGMTYYPAHDSLLLVGHAQYQKVAEVSIPVAVNAATVAGLPRATWKQRLTDVLEGHLTDVGTPTETAQIGGLLVWQNSLIVSDYLYYDGLAKATLSHFRSGLDFSVTGDVVGPVKMSVPAGFVAGYMAPIPPEWQAALGGPALTGQCCIPIIGRTSHGPAVSVFDPADVGIKVPVPAVQVLGYPIAHPTLGPCGGNATNLFNCSTTMGGLVFPPGTRTLLFIGRKGLGPYCYGQGIATQPAVPPDCYDPLDGGKGTHSYPYGQFVWAYDVLDLIAVKQGLKQPWDVLPYATWNLTLPFQSGNGIVTGVAFDPSTNRIFIGQDHADGRQPIVHVFTVAAATPSRPSAPGVPSIAP